MSATRQPRAPPRQLRSRGEPATTSRKRRRASRTRLPAEREQTADDACRADAGGSRVAWRRRSCRRRRGAPRGARRFSSAVASITDPSGVTISAPMRLSHVRPCCAVRWPMPPPRVSPHDASRADDAAGRDEIEGLRRGVEIEPGCTATRARTIGRPASTSTVRKSERSITSAPSDDAMSGRVVPTPTHRDLELVGTGEIKGGCDIAGAGATSDQRGAAVDECVEAPAGSVVADVVGNDD